MFADCIEKTTESHWMPDQKKIAWGFANYAEEHGFVPDAWCVAQPWAKRIKRNVRHTRCVSSVVRQEFRQLARNWKNDTEFLSSDTEVILHPSYQRIMGMGEKVLPLILENLRDEGGNWFWALRHITGLNPVAREDVGRSKKMKEVWLTWGRERHYL